MTQTISFFPQRSAKAAVAKKLYRWLDRPYDDDLKADFETALTDYQLDYWLRVAERPEKEPADAAA
ncbi:hypothetical protein [Pseudomonas mediterranea]|uniref:hypothetical protein n=1 Tax=Pseudomonas mediterranea TaxID=183795 RepID=UPI0006D8AB02|nr:hypothetical protein [Pseudomonas mediterranea]